MIQTGLLDTQICQLCTFSVTLLSLISHHSVLHYCLCTLNFVFGGYFPFVVF